ncbi:mps one binder kinase activator-like 1-like protein [Cladochytrium replicatum]|nr:mps one binder kinase activator-like 1-like protein [Cladochytrium replicatum]
MSFLGKLGRSKSKSSYKPLFLTTPFVEATLVNGSLRKLVAHPRYVDLNEWLAVNTFDFFNHTNHFYGSVSEFCDPRECPVMCAGQVEYSWVDSNRKVTKVSAPQYVDYVMSGIQNILNDESVFPTKSGIDFPRDFISHIRVIYKQLFRVFAHIFYSHFDKIVCLNAEGHLNTLFAHFVCFAREFDLLDKKELTPMSELLAEFEVQQRM